MTVFKKDTRRPKQHRQQWSCETVKRNFNPLSDKEMRQRLAELIELLLHYPRQLTEDFAFSSDSINSQNSKPCSNKQKGKQL